MGAGAADHRTVSIRICLMNIMRCLSAGHCTCLVLSQKEDSGLENKGRECWVVFGNKLEGRGNLFVG